MHRGKILISIFENFFASIKKIFNLRGRLDTRLWFYVVLRFSWSFHVFWDPISSVFRQLVINNQASFHWWWKENLVNYQKVSKYYIHDCLQTFLFLFMSFWKAPIVKNSHVLAGMYFIFKNVLDQTWKPLDTEFWPHWKDRKSSYQVSWNLALFCNLVALSLSWNFVKGLIVTKILKNIWRNLEQFRSNSLF